MKLVHYVLVCKQNLLMDSDVMFFPSEQDRDRRFKELTEPLLKIVDREDKKEAMEYVWGGGLIFHAGFTEYLDSRLVGSTTLFVKGSRVIEDEDTYFTVTFKEWQDEAGYEMIVFEPKSKAMEDFDVLVNDWLTGSSVDRQDESTWKDEDEIVLYKESSCVNEKEEVVYRDAYVNPDDFDAWFIITAEVRTWDTTTLIPISKEQMHKDLVWKAVQRLREPEVNTLPLAFDIFKETAGILNDSEETLIDKYCESYPLPSNQKYVIK